MNFRDMFAKFFGKENTAENKISEEELARFKKREESERRIAEEMKKKNIEKEKALAKAEANSVFFENDKMKVDVISNYERTEGFMSLDRVNENKFTFSNKETGAVVTFNHKHSYRLSGMDGYAREDTYAQYSYIKDGQTEDTTNNSKAREAMDVLQHEYVDDESLKIMNEMGDKSRILGGKDVLKLVDEARNKKLQEQEMVKQVQQNKAALRAKKDKDAELLSQFVSKNFKGMGK